MLAVPKLYVHCKGRDEGQYLKRMAYREVEAPSKDGGPPTKQYESTDQYTSRMQGYMLFYGALVQSERPGNPHDLAQGWQYLARCALSAIPEFGQALRLIRCVRYGYRKGNVVMFPLQRAQSVAHCFSVPT